MKLQLFLEDEEIELSKDVQFSLNKVYEDLSMPTNIIIDYSKAVTIPFSKHNCKVLGNIYRLDKLILSDKRNIGANIDPSRRIPMKLVYNGEVVLDGYAKFVSSNINNSKSTFTINLFSKLGDIFQKLKDVVVSEKQLTEDQKKEEDGGRKYILNDGIQENIKLDAKYVLSSWNFDDVDIEDQFYMQKPAHHIIGFAPAYRGGYNNFEKDKIQISNDPEKGVQSLEDYLKNYFFEKLKKEKGEVYANNMIAAYKPQAFAEKLTRDYQFDEFRSYNMKPYVYFNKLFYMFANKCKELTGYKLNIDSEWANIQNPYWAKLCYMLDFLENNGDKDTSSQKDLLTNFTGKAVGEIGDGEQIQYSIIMNAENISVNNINADNIIIMPFIIDITAICRDFPQYNVNSLQPTMYSVPNDKSGSIKFKFDIYDGDKFVNSFYAWNGLGDGDGTYNKNNKIRHDRFNVAPYTENGIVNIKKCHDYYYIPKIVLDKHKFTNKIKIKVICKLTCPSGSGTAKGLYTVSQGQAEWTPPLHSTDFTININDTKYETNISLTTVKLSNLYFSDKPVFDVLLQYTKMYGLVWDVDDSEKIICIKKRKNIFKNYNITCWDDKIDKNKDFIIEPVVFPVDKINFNYENVDGDIYSLYKDKYNSVYGEKTIHTTYKFNTDDLDLFSEVFPSSCSSQTYLTMGQVKSWVPEKTVKTIPDNKILINAESEDHESSVSVYNWYFREKNNVFSSPVFMISDDTPNMIAEGKSYWIDRNFAMNNGYAKFTDQMPVFTIVDESYGNISGCTFACPNEDFTYNSSIKNMVNNGIYDKFWKNYLNERYNIQNKKITCYVFLTPQEFTKFKFNNFVLLGGQLFMVNKIYDFNMNASLSSTKVELIQITNINDYME